MPIANVDVTNSLDYFRMITNQCIIAFNYLTNNTYSVSRLTVNPSPSTGFLSVNVANGLIYGNGSGIYSYTNAAITGTFRNSQLQNSSMTFANGVGVLVGTTSASLNTGTITISSNPVDSIVNASPVLPAAANAITRLIAGIGTISKTRGRFFQNVGGTGVVSYSNGQMFISNGQSGLLEVTTPLGLNGIISNPLGGFVGFTSNLISLGNIAFTSTGNSGVTVSQNVYPTATTTSLGVIEINNTITGEAILNEAGSANSLNAVSNVIAAGVQTGVINASGRLLMVNSYSVGGLSAADASNTYWAIGNVDAVSFLVVTVVAGGGGSSGANNNNSTSNYVMGCAGGSGASIKALITKDQLLNFQDEDGYGRLTIRTKNNGAEGGTGNPEPGERGAEGVNVQIGVSNTGGGLGYILFVEGGAGGQFTRTIANTGLSCNASTFRVAKAWANSQAASVLQKTAGRPGYPGMVIQRGAANGAGPNYHVVGWGGWPSMVQWESEVATTEVVPGLSGLYFKSRAALGLTTGTKSSHGEISIGTMYGVGGAGPISANSTDGTGYDRYGSVGAPAYIRIEAYTNA